VPRTGYWCASGPQNELAEGRGQRPGSSQSRSRGARVTAANNEKYFSTTNVSETMKCFSTLLCALLISCALFACEKNEVINQPATESFPVTINNGYGTGNYTAGDTVHIFTNHYTENQLFDKWSGDVSLLNAPTEWHTWFIMPNKPVTVTGSIKNITPFSLQYEQIRGRDRIKPVYSYFPTNHKGFVYLLHGTGGKASSLVSDYEFQQLIKDLGSNNFGIIITEAEEATTGVDVDGNGKLRWAISPVDTLANVDYVNIRTITNAFYTRGTTNRSKSRHSVGMSNGGAYSVALSAVYKFKTGVSYCAQGASGVIQQTQVPLQFSMARFDSNDEVGAAGNASALASSNSLNARGVCSKFLIKERCPIYPERFARSNDISPAKSIDIFNELKAKGYINNKNYFVGISGALISAYQANPSSFPSISSLSAAQTRFVQNQIDLCVSDHQMYSDYNRATIKFLNTQCQ
jgi:hypothetical protein